MVRGTSARPAVAAHGHVPVGRAGQRGHAAADAGRPGRAGVDRMVAPVAVPRRPGRRAGGRGDPGLGPARLSATRAAPARVRGCAGRAARAARFRPTWTSLLALPGVGGYTARAVAAFAFGQRHPVVDTNVRRLIARAVSGHGDGGGATTAADLVAVADLLPADPARAARASVAFMELGAVVCTARLPACSACPLRTLCRWRAGGESSAAGTATAAPATVCRHRPIRAWATARAGARRGRPGPGVLTRLRVARRRPEAPGPGRPARGRAACADRPRPVRPAWPPRLNWIVESLCPSRSRNPPRSLQLLASANKAGGAGAPPALVLPVWLWLTRLRRRLLRVRPCPTYRSCRPGRIVHRGWPGRRRAR